MRRLPSAVLFTLSSMLLLSPITQAQALSADEIAGKIEAAQKGLKDFSVKISGQAVLEGGTQKIDLEVSSIPAQNLTRIQFNAPDVLADNVLILDRNTLSNYLFLTNQVTIAPLNKSKVQGFSFDFARLTDATVTLSRADFKLKLLETQSTASGKTYLLEAIPRNTELGVSRSRITVLENGWRVQKVQALDDKGKVLSDLNFSGWKLNSGLSAATLKRLPRDAQVIRR